MHFRLSRYIQLARRIPGRLSASKDPRVRRGYHATRQLVRTVVNKTTHRQLGWVAVVSRAHWLEGGRYEVTGWAYERGFGHPDAPPRIRVWLQSPGMPRLEATVQPAREPLANTRLKFSDIDYSNTGFVAQLDVAEAVGLADRRRRWRVVVEVSGDGHTARSTLKRRGALGSAHHLLSRVFGEVQVTPTWGGRGEGLCLDIGRPHVLAAQAGLDGRDFSAELVLSRTSFSHAELVSPQGGTVLDTHRLHNGRIRVSGRLPVIRPDGPTSLDDPDEDEGLFSPELEGQALPILSYQLVATDTQGRTHQVRTSLDAEAHTVWPDEPPFLYPGPGGTVRLRDCAAMMVLTAVQLEMGQHPTLHFTGFVLGDLTGARLDFVGARAERQVRYSVGPDRVITGTCEWLTSNWGAEPRPPMSGRYTLRGHTAEGKWFRIACAPSIIDQAPHLVSGGLFNASVGVGGGRRLAVQISKPLQADEIGAYHQRRLQAHFHGPDLPLKEQFYFESFNGRQATCNPLALDREVARRFPDLPRYWGVMDHSVAVPEGAIAVPHGSTAWWDARQTSRFVITNEWLKNSFAHRPGQVVLQTWHGTMLKRIGLDRPAMDPVLRRSLLGERAKWDILLSQNRHSTEIFKTAYSWTKDIWEEGYPRNDDLVNAAREPVRELLGIRPEQKAILYAPTWRDNQTGMVTFLDLEQMVAALGDDYVLLLRGHSRTIQHGADVVLHGVIDVTSYPNITDLFLAADAMITDYSSVMFDFSVTGRPMIFFVPDMDQYRDSVRGVYFDLSEVAPGPVLSLQDEVVDALRDLDAQAARHTERYRAWQQRFNSHDDGQSAARVIDRLMGLG